MKIWMMLALSGAVLFLSGCAYMKEPVSADAGNEHLILLPTVRQATDHTCGVASLQSILMYDGIDCREDILAEKLHAKDHAGIDDIERCMTDYGFKVTQYRKMSLDELKKLIDRRLPVLVCVQAWEPSCVTAEQYRREWDSGHWVVVIGYDADNIYVMDPSTLGNYAYVPVGEFMARWHDRDEKETLSQFGMTFESPHPPVYRPGEIKRMR